jgi:H/ACA ribonucleoprotein complex subunit 4
MVRKNQGLPAEKNRSRLVKIQAITNPHYGMKPSDRNLKDLLAECLILLDKPAGPTCHQIDSWVKKILTNDKVGHAGTLGPGVTGVLPLGIGRATRALPVLTTAGKEYVAVMKLHTSIDSDKVYKAIRSFQGEIVQLPPLRSAVKRVRRKRTIYYIHPQEMEGKKVLFQVGCQAGTYIRTLCVDIGKKLKTGAHLEELRRTKVGRLTEHDLITLHDLKDAFVFWQEEGDEDPLFQILRPWEDLLHPLPKIVIRDSAVDAVCHGANLALPGIVEVDTDIARGDMVAMMTLKGEGVAFGSALCSTEEIIQKDAGIAVNIDRVLMAKGTYPSIWKKHK